MLNEVIILTSSKDLHGVGVFDLKTITPVTTSFKGNVSDAGSVCVLGGGSSFSGDGASDYVIIAQSKKPSIQVWNWGKVQPLYTCHCQEVLTSLAVERFNSYIIGGSKKGNVYIWDAATGTLLITFQAHYKEITRIITSSNHDFFCSASSDGSCKVWDLLSLIDTTKNQRMKQSKSAYRSWNPHTLPIKDAQFGADYTSMRVYTCSIDRSFVIYDINKAVQLLRLALAEPLESLTINPTQDFCFLGSSNGSIYVIDLSIAALHVCHVTLKNHQNNQLRVSSDTTSSSSSSNNSHKAQLMTLEGHTKAISSLQVSRDNSTLVSASEDGSLRLWDIWTGQCIKESKPLNKAPITNMMVRVLLLFPCTHLSLTRVYIIQIILKPEHIQLATGSYAKFHLTPLGFLQKYTQTSANQGATADGNSDGNSLTLAPAVLPCIKPSELLTALLEKEEQNKTGQNKR